MKVKDILKIKGPEVFTIGAEKTLTEALQVLVNNHIGVLIVIDNVGQTIGIISERDILRAVNTLPDSFSSQKVADFMTKNVIVIEPEDELSYIEQILTDNRIRHLPVLSNKILVGLISIGDVVKSQLKNISSDNKYMIDYISGNVK